MEERQPPGAGARNEALPACKRFGRTIPGRAREVSGADGAATTAAAASGPRWNCVKLLGQKLAARDFDRQTAEFQIRVAILNRYTALGIPATRPVA